MLKFYVKTRDSVGRLRTDKDGVVSFEYVVLAACIVGVVVAVFGTGAQGILGTALTNAITAVAGAVTAAV